MGPTRPLFVYFRISHMTNIAQIWLYMKVYMVCLGFEPGWQGGRHRWIHWAMAAPRKLKIITIRILPRGQRTETFRVVVATSKSVSVNFSMIKFLVKPGSRVPRFLSRSRRSSELHFTTSQIPTTHLKLKLYEWGKISDTLPLKMVTAAIKRKWRW